MSPLSTNYRFLSYALLTLCLVAIPASTCSWDYPIWIPRSNSADPLFRFVKGQKAGYIDTNGKIVVLPVLRYLGGNHGDEFHDGLLEIGVSGGVYVNTKGEKTIHKSFHRGWDFSEGLAAAMDDRSGKWGYINTRGGYVISPRFANYPDGYVSSFREGFAKIVVAGKVGYIDKSGTFVIPPQFLDGDSFFDGMARVVVDGPCVYHKEDAPCPDFGVLPKGTKAEASLPACRYSFIDTSGRVISDMRFDYSLNFSEGLAPVRIGPAWGYVDKQGTMVISPRFEHAWPFSGGLARVKKNGKSGFIDHAGSYFIQPTLSSAEDFSDGVAVVGAEDTGYWYIDRSGQSVLAGKFPRASSFFKGLAHVQLDEGTFAYINRAGKRVFTYQL